MCSRLYAETGDSYISINSIANTEAYIETVRACGFGGERCRNIVCDATAALASKLENLLAWLLLQYVAGYLQTGNDGLIPMAPQAEVASTVSFPETKNHNAKQTQCNTPIPYAGCMTATCTFEKDKNSGQTGFFNCRCPLFTGPFQVGQDKVNCDLGDGNVWSAAYCPPSEQ